MLSVDDLIVAHGLGAHAEAIRGLVRPCVSAKSERVHTAIAGSRSRLGGLPHLPAGMEWPMWRGNPLGHIATIKLSEAAALDRSGLLPRRGLLFFWYALADDAWGFDPEDRGFCRVTYVEDEEQPLVQTPFPRAPGAKAIARVTPLKGVFHECGLRFAAAQTLPNWEWIEDHAPECSVLAKLDAYRDLLEELEGLHIASHRLLGHAQLVQGPWELECQLVTHGLYCGDASGYKDPRAAALKAGAKDWRLLLQVDTDMDGPGWMWGDTGVLYYAIPERALRERRFDEAWMVMQCC